MRKKSERHQPHAREEKQVKKKTVNKKEQALASLFLIGVLLNMTFRPDVEEKKGKPRFMFE